VSGDAFRDALTDVVFAGRWRSDCGEGTADAILAMSEMEAIRAYLGLRYRNYPEDSDVRIPMRLDGLPESVIDWLLGGPS
jgi:hypothetical protein